MQPDTLHTHLRDVIEERLKVARIRAEKPTTSTGNGAYDPADAVRRYTAALRVLDRHAVWLHEGTPRCDCCPADSEDVPAAWPCDEVRDLAASLGVEIDT